MHRLLPVSARLREAAVSFGLVVLFAACGGGGADAPSTAPLPGGQTGSSISIAIAPSAATIAVGASQPLAAAVSGTTNTAVNWSTSASSIATVSSSGVVTGVAPGTATITAAAVADPSRIATATITVSAPAPLVLRLPVDTVRQGVLMRVVVAGSTVPTSTSATIGGVTMSLGQVDDTTMAGVVPEAPAGVQVLRIETGGRVGTANVTVRAGALIANPVATITAMLDANTQRFASSTPPAGWSSADWTRSRTVADSLSRALRSALSTASVSDQLAVARALESIRSGSVTVAPSAPVSGGSAAWLSASAPSLSGDEAAATPLLVPSMVTALPGALPGATPSLSLPPACAAAISEVTRHGYRLAGSLVLMHAMAPFVSTGVGTLVGLGAGVAFYNIIPELAAATASMPAACTIPRGVEVRGLAGTIFDSGKALLADLLLQARSFGGSDANEPEFRGVAGVISDLVSRIGRLPAAIRSWIGVTPTPLDRLPTGATTTRSLSASEVRVSNVSPSSVSVVVTGSGSQSFLTASTTATTETPFSASLALVADESIRTTVSGTVRPAVGIVVTVSPSTITIAGAGTERTVTATVTGTTNTGLNWTSNDSRVVTVVGTPIGGSAVLRAQNPGTTTVRVVSIQDPTKFATIAVTVTSGIGITVTPQSATLTVGETQRLVATLSGTNSTGVLWQSGTESVATVDAAGFVTARAVGTTVITARAALDLEAVARVTITVTAPAIVISVSPTSASIPVGGTQFLAVSLTGVPSGQSTLVSWTSSNSSVVSVSPGGGGLTITGLSVGTSIITLRSDADPTKVATATITVTSGGTTGATRLSSGIAVNNLAGAAGSSRLYVISVPAGATGLTVRTSGGVGDVDLYVRRGSPPTSSAADCTSEDISTVESCAFTNPTTGDWYILLVGYEAYSGVTLTATVTGGSTPPPATSPFLGGWRRYGNPNGYNTDLQVGGIPGEPANRVYLCTLPPTPNPQLIRGTLQSDGFTIRWDAVHNVPDYEIQSTGATTMQLFVPAANAVGGTYQRGSWRPGSCGFSF